MYSCATLIKVTLCSFTFWGISFNTFCNNCANKQTDKIKSTTKLLASSQVCCVHLSKLCFYSHQHKKQVVSQKVNVFHFIVYFLLLYFKRWQTILRTCMQHKRELKCTVLYQSWFFLHMLNAWGLSSCVGGFYFACSTHL